MATTINSYSVGFGMDASSYIDGAKISRSETRKLISDINAARSPAEEFAVAQDRLTKALDSGAISLEVHNRLVDAAKDKYGLTAEAKREEAEATERINRLTREGEAVTRSMMTAEEQHAIKLRELKQLYETQSIGITTYKRALESAENALRAQNPEHVQHNRLIEEGRRLTLQHLNPLERYSHEQERLNQLLRAGAISQQTYDRALDSVRPKLEVAAEVTAKKVSAMERLSHASNVVTAGIASARAAIDTFNATKEKIDEVADRVANTADQARSLGMTFNDLFSMQFAAKQAGAPLGAIETAIKQMMKRGFAGTDVKESFLQIADEISGMANQSERMQRAFEVFGKSGSDVVLMLQEGRDAIEENIQKAERYNQLTEAQVIAAERYGDAVDEANLAWEGTTNLLVSEFAPAMSIILEDMIKFKESLDGSALSLQSITEMTTRVYGFGKDASEFVNLPISNMKNLLNMDFSGWVSDLKEGFTFNQAGEMVAELEKKRNELENAAVEREKEREEKKKQAILEGIAEKEQKEKDAKDRAIQEEEKKRLESEERIAQEAIRAEERKQQEIRRMMEQSFAAASKKFDEENKKRQALADSIAKGPADLEVGSAGAAKFTADLENRQFAEAIAKEITPGETELIAEAQKQFELMQQANAKQTEQITALQRLIEITSQNGFRKTR